VRILSYNLLHHRASVELESLADAHAPDVVCVQEAHAAELPARVGGLELATTTTEGTLGLGLYVHSARFAVTATRAYRLRKGVHDVVFLPGTQRLLAARLVDRRTGERMTVASFHAAPLTATNILRRHQVAAAHAHLAQLGDGDPIVMIGDFNYPLFRGALERRVSRDGFAVSTSDAPTYRHSRTVSSHFDFLTSRGVDVASVTTLPAGLSDHRPILADATASAPAARHVVVRPDESAASLA
jgi:endonuclease/exonuclease/phosphatase family metal-dependent hydrolase